MHSLSFLRTLRELCTLSRFRCHKFVELRVHRELIGKRNKRTADLDKSVPRFNIGDIGHLQIGDIEQFCKFNSVSRSLIEHIDKLRVGKHRSCGMALLEVIHVLRDTRCKCTVFSYSFPKGKEEVCGIFVLEKQVNLINEDKGVLAFRSVLRDSV